MTILIHDLTEEEFARIKIAEKDVTVIQAKGDYAPCQGCYKCWLKNAGYCVMKDKMQHIGSLMGNSDNVVIISENYYGCYHPAIKNILDRSISTSLPFFTYRNREVHHMSRYPKKNLLKVYLYGDCTDSEKAVAQQFVKANAVNMCVKEAKLEILASVSQLQEMTV